MKIATLECLRCGIYIYFDSCEQDIDGADAITCAYSADHRIRYIVVSTDHVFSRDWQEQHQAK